MNDPKQKLDAQPHCFATTNSCINRLFSSLGKAAAVWLFLLTSIFTMSTANASTPLPNSTIYVAEWSRLKHLAAEGNPEAQFQLGNMYYLPPRHSGIPKNFHKAFNLFQQAASQGHATAQHNLAVLYYRGEGVDIDRVKAIAWFSIAKKNGSKSATKHLNELNRDIDAETQQRVQMVSKQIQVKIQQAKTAQ